MTAFAAAMAVLFGDPHLSVVARYRVQDRGEGRALRVIRRNPDRVVGFGEARIVAETGMFDLPLADVPDLAAGDTLEIAGDLGVLRWRIQGTPLADRDPLFWTAEAAPLAPHRG